MQVSPQTFTGSSWTTEPQGVAAGLPSFLDVLTQIKLRWVLQQIRGVLQPFAKGELSLCRVAGMDCRQTAF